MTQWQAALNIHLRSVALSGLAVCVLSSYYMTIPSFLCIPSTFTMFAILFFIAMKLYYGICVGINAIEVYYVIMLFYIPTFKVQEKETNLYT